MLNKDNIMTSRKKNLQLVICFMVSMALLCGMCGCSKENDNTKKGIRSEDYLEKCVTMKKYEKDYVMESINMEYTEKAEYEAVEDNSKIVGYKATLSLRCEADIPEEDLVKLACEELSFFIHKEEGEADIVECVVSIASAQNAMQYMLIRFSEKSRSEYVVYLSKEAEGEIKYHIKTDIPENMIFYTEITVNECEYELSKQVGNLTGMSVIKEVTILKEMKGEELNELLESYILNEQEILAGTEGGKRIEYVFEVYLYGEKYKTVTMRAVDKEMSDWEYV